MVLFVFSRPVAGTVQGGMTRAGTPGSTPGSCSRCRCRGSVATLIELLVVLSIIAFLASYYLRPHRRVSSQETVPVMSSADPVATVEAARQAAAQAQQTQTRINREIDNALK